MLLTVKSTLTLKESLFKSQNGCCALCNRPFEGDYTKQHLDHDHALEGKNAGRVRGLLCLYCNRLEGDVQHKFKFSGLNSRGIEYIEWLEALIKYLKADYSKNAIHMQYPRDMKHKFKTLSLPEMRNAMSSFGLEYNDKDKKADLIEKFNKQFKKAIK
ncbi:endonuclease VII [Aeromonas phage GomatiRiver_11]|nr:recombination endonuclease VII [Aeromonas phage AhFM11]WKW84302.1 endonuclease VII [Aeromonas phage GomatiRiver_11]